MAATDAAMRSRIARIGGNTAVAKHGGLALTANARIARQTKLNASLIEQYGLDPSATDYPTRLKAARSAYYALMSLKRTKKAAA